MILYSQKGLQCLHWQVLYSYIHLPLPCFPSSLSSSPSSTSTIFPFFPSLSSTPLPCSPASKGLDVAACHCCHGGGGPCLLCDCHSSGLDQVLCHRAKNHCKPQPQSQLRHYICAHDIITCTHINRYIAEHWSAVYSVFSIIIYIYMLVLMYLSDYTCPAEDPTIAISFHAP